MAKIDVTFVDGQVIHCVNSINITQEVKITKPRKNNGVITIFDKDESPLFWNHNVKFPVEYIYIGADLSIKSISALDKESRDIIVCTTPCRYMIAVEYGTCERLSIKVGGKIEDPCVSS